MNLFSSFLVVLALFSCGTKNKSAAGDTEAKQGIKTEISQPAKKVTITGTITQTFSYCGGAAPPDFLLEELATPKPFPKKKLYLIKGDTNTTSHQIVLDFTSDSLGKFSFQVEAGIYSIILEEQLASPNAKSYKNENQDINEECYKKWWGTPYYLLEVPATAQTTTMKGLNFNFHHRCFIKSDVPCLAYTGPMPP